MNLLLRPVTWPWNAGPKVIPRVERRRSDAERRRELDDEELVVLLSL